MNKKTMVFGASSKESRYSYVAARLLAKEGIDKVLLGKRAGVVAGDEILTEWPKEIADLHTITMYMGAKNQQPFYDYLLALKPKRIVFNPGAENGELAARAKAQGIEVEEACTLVMIRTGQY